MNFMTLAKRTNYIRCIEIEQRGYEHYMVIRGYTINADILLPNEALLKDDELPFVSVAFDIVERVQPEQSWKDPMDVRKTVQIIELTEESLMQKMDEFLTARGL